MGVKDWFDIGAEIVGHIIAAIERGDEAETRRLIDVWPEPTRSRLAMLAAEEKARQRVRNGA